MSKKTFPCYHSEVYLQLQEHPVKNTPVIYKLQESTPTPGSSQTCLTIIEEYLPGSTLAELLEEEGVFSEKETIDIAMQLCRILMDLHGLKNPIIHRDIKPSNVMRSPDGTIKLLDFNAAKTENTAQSRDTVLIGTAGFAAPEQYGFSSSSPQTDIYAVGVLMNVCLTRVLPSEKLAAGKLNKVIRHCLELNPKDRYQNVRELYHTLKRMSKVKAEWLLPGFRTLHPLKMLLALAGYIFLIAVVVTPAPDSFKSILAMYSYRIGIFVIGLLIVFFYCDYLGLRRWFPFMRSQHKTLRLIGFILAPVLIIWLVVVIMVIAETLIV